MKALATALTVMAVLAPVALANERVHQLVVFKSGRAKQSRPAAAGVITRIGHKRCAVGARTPLAALIRSRVGPLSLRDYGSCSRRAGDAGGLFVRSISGEHNRGSDGWVYKVGKVLGTAGAADPSGPFGRGRMRPGAWVTWFWCHVSARNRGCPHTLGLTVDHVRGGVVVHVRQYDDRGRGGPAAGAVVHVGSRARVTGGDGAARVRAPRGGHDVWATQHGRIRSFTVRTAVR